jgi:hypothetical protein
MDGVRQRESSVDAWDREVMSILKSTAKRLSRDPAEALQLVPPEFGLDRRRGKQRAGWVQNGEDDWQVYIWDNGMVATGSGLGERQPPHRVVELVAVFLAGRGINLPPRP